MRLEHQEDAVVSEQLRRARRRGERSAWISILGFASIMFCYLGVNIWISGLHSYKM